MPKPKDLTNQVFGRLTVIERAENDKYGRCQWLCECECGTRKVIASQSLVQGRTISCGCLAKERAKKRMTTHGLTGHSLHVRWFTMKQRCNCPTKDNFKHYGGRGIKVCDEWQHDFQNFYNWAITNGYRKELELDRIDVNGNYSPENCRWITHKEQMSNTRWNRHITIKGETKTLSEWCRQYGIKRKTVYRRLDSGWSVEDAFTKPLCKGA